MKLNEKMALMAEIAATVARYISDCEGHDLYERLATVRGAVDEVITEVLEAHAMGSFRRGSDNLAIRKS